MENHCIDCKCCNIITDSNGYVRAVCTKSNRDILEHKWSIKKLFQYYFQKKEVKFEQDTSIAASCINQALKFRATPNWCKRKVNTK